MCDILNHKCCICLDSAPIAITCSCSEGKLCYDCTEVQLSRNDYNCPICRQQIFHLRWHKRLDCLIEDLCYIGIWWLIGYFALQYGWHISDIDNDEELLYSFAITYGSLCCGVLLFHWLGIIIYGIFKELDEMHVYPLSHPNQSDQEFETMLAEHSLEAQQIQRHSSSPLSSSSRTPRPRYFAKRCVHFLAKYLNKILDQNTAAHNLLCQDTETAWWVFKAKCAIIIPTPVIHYIVFNMI